MILAPKNNAVSPRVTDGRMDDAIDSQLQSSFFRPPIEIRCSIYEILLGTETPAPESLDEANRMTRCEQKLKAPGPHFQFPSYYQTPASSLLLTCRKTLLEVSGLQQRLYKLHGTATCKLDLIINDDYTIPTWTYAPGQDRETEYNLEVSLRLMDALYPHGLFFSDGWTGAICAPLMAILNSLLHHGPQFLPPARTPAPQPLRFNAITMAVSCPSSHGVGPCELYYVPPLRKAVPNQALLGVFGFMCDLEGSGLLWGKVREMRIYSMQLGQGMSVKVTHEELSQTEIDFWASCGYTWGLDA